MIRDTLGCLSILLALVGLGSVSYAFIWWVGTLGKSLVEIAVWGVALVFLSVICALASRVGENNED